MGATVLPVAAAPPEQLKPPSTPSVDGFGQHISADDSFDPRIATPFPDQSASTASIQTSGGPDTFGYWWNDNSLFNWIDARTGVQLPLTGDDNYYGPVDIGFNFRYYENNYVQLYVSTNGLISLGEGTSPYSNQSIPMTEWPNNLIAPFWDDLCVSCYISGSIYYRWGGSAPFRYFVVAWHDVTRYENSGPLTFEVVLYENGDIVMQYLTLSGTLNSTTVGIENATGSDGLLYLYNASGLVSGKAIRFYRPPPAGRVAVNRHYEGALVTPGSRKVFSFQARNTGDAGNDVYDLSSNSGWPVSFFREDGATPLTDSDGDGLVDTGSVEQNSLFTVTAQIMAPPTATIGESNTATITMRSSRTTEKYESITLQTAVPAPFAQVYIDSADGAMSFYLARPAEQLFSKASPENQRGRDVAVAELPNGAFVYIWGNEGCAGSFCELQFINLEYALLGRYATPTGEARRLTDHSSAAINTYDLSPALAVTPDGAIGVFWRRRLYNNSNGTSNENLWFVTLTGAGNPVGAPINLTNNSNWNTGNDLNVPQFFNPHITATTDNRFVLAWNRSHLTNAGWVDDIYYSVRASSGSEIHSITKLTNSTPGTVGFYQSALAQLTSGRTFLSWNGRQNSNDDIYFVVLDSNGALLKQITNLSIDETVVDWWNWDAVQLSDGKILAAWEAWGCYADEWTPRIRFVLLDASFNRIGEPQCLPRLAATAKGDTSASLAADHAGHVVFTWKNVDDGYQRDLYYALLNTNGTIQSPPMIFRTSQTITSTFQTNAMGYGNTTVSYIAGSPQRITMSTSAPTLTADGSSQSTITAAVSDALGNRILDIPVTFVTSLGMIVGQAVTDVNGYATVQLTAGIELGTAIVGSTAGAARSQIEIPLVAGPPAVLTLTAETQTLIADGSSQSVIRATVRDAYTHLLAGKAVNFSTTLGTITGQATTDANGETTVMLTAGLTLGAATVTASTDGASNQIDVQLGLGPATSISVVADRASVTADDKSQVRITATVHDEYSHPVPNFTLTFESTLGTIATQATTDANGSASAFLDVGKQAGTAIVTVSSGSLIGQTNIILLAPYYSLYLPAIANPKPPASKPPVPQFVNSGFEQGAGIGWQELVNSTPGTLIYAYGAKPAVPKPVEGSYVAWLGGKPNQINTLRQTLLLPQVYSLGLRYVYYIASEESNCNNDHVIVRLTTNQTQRILDNFNLCNTTATGGNWQARITDLPGEFNGSLLTLTFESTLNGSNNSNFFLDAVTLCSDDPTAPIATQRCAAAQ